ncbi:MAG: Holliday junction branch migration protein RuvA [Chthonomonadaceae bacterium]|nr:Holliday junction branch migration protein RuvA [Chthonomonadaceae bacterium]
MIAQLTGLVVRTEANSVILDVNGVGYQCYVPATVLANLPEASVKMTLATHVVTRGQPDFEITLYGFLNSTDSLVFKMLISATGVGPKVALAMLSTLTVDELSRALSASDTRLLTKVPGVGPKLAQRLCLDLGDKMAVFAFDQKVERTEAGKQTSEENAAYEDAVEGLIGFGFSRLDVRKAVDRASANVADKTDAASLITSALALLNPKK